jgi:hypothetical protein
MDRRNFLQAFLQAFFLAFFPFLRERPAAAQKLAQGLAPLIEQIRSAKQCPVWNMPVIEQVRWTIGGPLA